MCFCCEFFYKKQEYFISTLNANHRIPQNGLHSKKEVISIYINYVWLMKFLISIYITAFFYIYGILMENAIISIYIRNPF